MPIKTRKRRHHHKRRHTKHSTRKKNKTSTGLYTIPNIPNIINKKITLLANKDGTRLVLMPNRNDSTTASVNFYVKVGSKYEPAEISGISHFIEHMLFKGSPKYKTFLDISKKLDSYGIDFNAFTSKDITGYTYKFLSNHDNMSLICNIAHDILYNSFMREKDIKLEREVIIQEYNDDIDDIDEFINDQLEIFLFDKHPLAKPIIGDLKTLHKINKHDIITFYKKYYKPDNILIGISGNFDDKYSTIINNCFKNEFKEIDLHQQQATTIIPFADRQTSFKVKCIYKPLSQDYIHIIFKTVGYFSKDTNILKIIANLLGRNMSSRFFVEIREKLGLVYSIKCELTNYEEIGYFDIYMQNEAKDTSKCICKVFEELQKLKKYGVTQSELDSNIKNYCDTLITNFDDITYENEFYCKQILFNKPFETINDRINNIRQITINDVNKLASELFDLNKVNIICFGKSKQNKIKQIIHKYL
jgi:predicted Zn-dependent peptidase